MAQKETPHSDPNINKFILQTDYSDYAAGGEGSAEPFASHASNNAPVWAIYGKQAKFSDEQIFKRCNSDLDSLLIFASLFSAILSAFLIEIRKGLQEDLAGTTNVLLLSLIELQRNETAVPAIHDPFVPSTSSRWINGLWFSSLAFSLMGALGASLAKGWVAQYNQSSSGITADEAIIISLPLFVQIAFFQFFSGLVVLLLQDDVILAYVILALISVTTILYISITLLPAFSPDCPFQTPLSRPASRAILFTKMTVKMGFNHALNFFVPLSRRPDLTEREADASTMKAEALSWLLQNSTNGNDIRAAIKALAGLPTTPEVEKSLHEGN